MTGNLSATKNFFFNEIFGAISPGKLIRNLENEQVKKKLAKITLFWNL